MEVIPCVLATPLPSSCSQPAADGATAEETPAAAAAEATPEPKEEEGPKTVELVPRELTGGHPTWEGWIAEGPESAKIMKGGIKGVRIADNKNAGFDLTIEARHKKLADFKEGIEKGASMNEGTEIEYLVDTDDKLEWKRSSKYGTTWSFIHNFEIDGRKVTCGNNTAIGLKSEAHLEQHKKACQSLRKGSAGDTPAEET